MALGQQQRQDPTAPLFAVDTDITPLQSKYFEYAEKAFKDPDELSRAYSSIVNTFGSIQQARDIQNERTQRDEDRAIQNQLRNTQLDASRFELAQARDKVREKQQSLGQASSFLQGVNQIKSQFADDPARAYREINAFGAANAPAFENPAVKNTFELTLNSLRTPEELRPKRELNLGAGFFGNLGSVDEKTAEKIYPGSSGHPEYLAARASFLVGQETKGESKAQRKVKADQIEEEKSNHGLMNVSKALGELVDPVKLPILPLSKVDAGLKALHERNLLTDEDKKRLSEVGLTVGGLIPKSNNNIWPTLSAKHTDKESTDFNSAKSALQEKQRAVVGDIAARFEFGILKKGAAPTAATSGSSFNFNVDPETQTE